MLRASGRLGTGLWRRVSAADIQPSAPSSLSPIPPDPAWKSVTNFGRGVAEDGKSGDFDEATSAWIKLKNQSKIFVHGLTDAVVEGSMSSRPIILFYTGGINMDAIVYSDAMVPLATRSTFGLVTEKGPDLRMKNASHSPDEFHDQTYPRVLVVMPLFQNIELFKALDRKQAGQGSGAIGRICMGAGGGDLGAGVRYEDRYGIEEVRALVVGVQKNCVISCVVVQSTMPLGAKRNS